MQDPVSTVVKVMPEVALAVVGGESDVMMDQIGPLLWSLARTGV